MSNQELSKTGDEVTPGMLKDYLKAANLVAHLTDTETDQFISVAQAYGLNPFKREIYASKYGNNFSIVVGYETYIKRAERSGRLDGWKVETEGKVNHAKPRESSLKAVITIYRDDFKHPFVHEVYFAEYCQFTNSGQMTKFWQGKPVTMIKKVVMSQGFRLCFSDELGGIPYTKEEIGEDASFEIIESKPGVKKEEPKPEPAPVKQYEEEQDPEKDFLSREKSIQEMIDFAGSREDLKGVFNAYPLFKTLPAFLAMIKKRTEEIDGIEEAEVVEEEEETNPPLLPSEDYDAKEAIKFVRKFTDPDKLAEFTINEERKSVLDVVSSKLKAFNDEK